MTVRIEGAVKGETEQKRQDDLVEDLRRWVEVKCGKRSGAKELGEDLARFANLYFLFLVDILGAIAESPRHVPAHMAAIKFPSWTLLLDRAQLFFPAAQRAAFAPALIEIEKIEEFFGVGWHGAPALLVAMDGLEGDTKQLGELLLGFAHFFADKFKVFPVHGLSPCKT